jgi:hypothetical protein
MAGLSRSIWAMFSDMRRSLAIQACSIIPGREVACTCGRTVHGTCAQLLRSQGAYKCPVCHENELKFLQTRTAGKLTSDDVDFIFSEIFKEENK